MEWLKRIDKSDVLDSLATRLTLARSLRQSGEAEDLSVLFDRTYWVIPGMFLAGCYPGSEDAVQAERKLKAMVEHGIRHVINLMEPREVNWSRKPFAPYEQAIKAIGTSIGVEVLCVRMPIEDLSVPSEEEMKEILDHVDGALRSRRPVYVHCRGGIGRTGTVVGCFLARHGLAAGRAVLQLIRELRRRSRDRNVDSPETRCQRDMVVHWQKGL